MNRGAEPEALLAVCAIALCAIALCALAGGAIGLLTCGLAQLSALEPLLLLPLCLLSSCTLLLLEPLPLLPLPLCLLSCALLTLLAAVAAGAAPRRVSHRGAETQSLSMPVQAAVHGSRAVPLSHLLARLPDRADRLVLVRPPRQSAVAAAAALQ